MDRQATTRLLEETFGNDFDLERFSRFVKELFNKFNLSPKTWNVWMEYRDYIDSYQLLGSFRQGKEIIDVLVVKLKKSTSLRRARTMQRNFVAKYLNNAGKDAALVAFYEEGSPDWRFSFVKMEYRLKEGGSGKIRVEKELTPAKRYSFLVGKNEPNHTCKKQFLELVVEEEKFPSVNDIESAFSIEKVTKDFFNEYKELYLELKESLDNILENDSRVKGEFEEKGISAVDFSKKLLGQIVFIYFLQKKGWLGVQKPNKEKFQSWGSGPKNFLRILFNKEIVPYNNFFNEILEPLFYEALATQRDDDYYSRFNCKIPFLNGGLFEPIGDYDWVETDIVLDNAIFARILETFDRYNFTIKEDEPLEKEVAIDPEMLGKVFENLIEENIRKGQGSYYTPREIVHYMCQQSLINYLETNTNIPRSDIEKFIRMGEFALDLIIKEQEQVKKYGKSYGINENFNLPKSIKENYLKIDELLKSIKIIDPAVGSGAFPVGMMTEMVKVRSVLTSFFPEEKRKGRTDYSLKRETIENCLYGVDIDSSAVDIAKLRFWLSLIVDELDMKNIKPLPNLDHKIMVGNSLLEEFEGVKLFDEQLLGEPQKQNGHELEQIDKEMKKLYLELGEIHRGLKKSGNGGIKEIQKELKRLEREKNELMSGTKDEDSQTTLQDALSSRIKQSRVKLNGLKKLQKLFFNEQNRELKKKYAREIDRIEWELIEETLKEQGNEEATKKLKQYKKSRSKPFFLWKLYFAEVFQRENPGFDIVIANPPYVRVDDVDKEIRPFYKNNYRSAQGKYDLYYLFFEIATRITSSTGTFVFITPNKFCAADSAKVLRDLILDNNHRIQIVSTSKLKVFEAASNYPIITLVKKGEQNNTINVIEATELNLIGGLKESNNSYSSSSESLSIIPEKVIPINTTQHHIKLITNLYRKHSILSNALSISEGLRIPSKDESEKDIGVPIVKQYQFSKYSDISEGSYITKKRFSEICSSTSDRFKKIMQDKIVIAEDALFITATLDSNKMIPQGGVYFAVPTSDLNIKFLLGLINSRVLSVLYEILYSGMHMGGGYLRYRSKFLENLPFPKSSIGLKESLQKPIIKLVDQILAITKYKNYPENPDKQVKVRKLEKKIDQIVYKLYGLTPEEIKILEGKYEQKVR